MVNIPGVPITHWASWSSHRRWTPPWIHDEHGENWIIQFMDHFSTSADIYVHSIGVIEYFLLVCGLLVRDISEGQFSQGDPDEEVSGRYPPWITGSCLKFSMIDLIAATVSKMWNKAKVLPRVHPLPQLPPGQTHLVSADPANEPIPRMGSNLDEGFIDPRLNASGSSLSSHTEKVVAPLNKDSALAAPLPKVKTTVSSNPATLQISNQDKQANENQSPARSAQALTVASQDDTATLVVSNGVPASSNPLAGDTPGTHMVSEPKSDALSAPQATQPQPEGGSAGTSEPGLTEVFKEAQAPAGPMLKTKRKPKARQPPRKKTAVAADVSGRTPQSNIEQGSPSTEPTMKDGNAASTTLGLQDDHPRPTAREPPKRRSATPTAQPTDRSDGLNVNDGSGPSNQPIVEQSTSTSGPPTSRQSDRLQAKTKFHWTLKGDRTTIDPQAKAGSSSKAKGSKKRRAADTSATEPVAVKRVRSSVKRGGKQG